MDILILNKERISKLNDYYYIQFTDDILKNSVKVKYNTNEFIIWLVYVDLDFIEFKKNFIYFGQLKTCLKDIILEPLSKNKSCKITLNFCEDYFDSEINFIGRKEIKKIEILVNLSK